MVVVAKFGRARAVAFLLLIGVAFLWGAAAYLLNLAPTAP